MLDPFVRFPADLLESVIRSRLSGGEVAALLFIIRQTHGYRRPETEGFCSILRMAEATGMSRRSTTRSLASLQRKGVIIQTRRGGPGCGASSYTVAPASEWGCTRGISDPSDRNDTSKPHPGRDLSAPSDSGVPSDLSVPIGSDISVPIGRVKSGTLIQKENRERTDNPPKPPQGGKTWTADKLYFQLGGRGTIPPFVQGKWLAISERSDEDLQSALERVTNFANPRARFLEQFDDEGKDVSPGWARNGHTSTEKTWTAESLWAEMQAEDAAKVAKEAECKA